MDGSSGGCACRTRKGITAARPADFGNPFLFTYIMPGNSPEFLRYVNYWLKLEETGKFSQQMIDHWIQGQPLPDHKPRWSIIRDVLHWGNSSAKEIHAGGAA